MHGFLRIAVVSDVCERLFLEESLLRKTARSSPVVSDRVIGVGEGVRVYSRREDKHNEWGVGRKPDCTLPAIRGHGGRPRAWLNGEGKAAADERTDADGRSRRRSGGEAFTQRFSIKDCEGSPRCSRAALTHSGALAMFFL